MLTHIGHGLELADWEHLIGDKAYIAHQRVITPVKLQQKRLLTEEEVRTNKFLQLVRSPVERCISRPHRFRLFKYCPYNEDICDALVHLACVALSLDTPQTPSAWLSERVEPAPQHTREHWFTECGKDLVEDNPDSEE